MPGKAHGQLDEHGERSGGRVLPHCAAISAHSCIGHYTLRSGARLAIFLFTQTNLTSSYLATLRCCCTDQTRTRFTLSHDAAAPIRHPSGSPTSRGCFAGQITLLNWLTSILSHNAASPINIPCSASLLPSCLTMLFHRCFCTSLSTSRCLSSWRSPATAFVTAREYKC